MDQDLPLAVGRNGDAESAVFHDAVPRLWVKESLAISYEIRVDVQGAVY